MDKSELQGKTYVKVWNGGEANNTEWCGLLQAFRKTSVVAHLDKDGNIDAIEQIDNRHIFNALTAPQP